MPDTPPASTSSTGPATVHEAGPSGGVLSTGAGFVPSLVAAISRGDTGALSVFYETWFDGAFDTARSVTRRDESFCMDIVQDAMLRAIRSLRPSLGLREKGDLDRWMTRVVHTTALDHLRRESRRLARQTRRASDEAHRRAGTGQSEPSDAAELSEQIQWLRARLDELTQSDRELLALRFSHEHSLESSGRASGMTGAAAHGRIRRLLERLRGSTKESSHER
jgi:RNA polymerase sigma factor (sigma-70 family)